MSLEGGLSGLSLVLAASHWELILQLGFPATLTSLAQITSPWTQTL